jgi:DNA-binding transcriptional regulator YiaG
MKSDTAQFFLSGRETVDEPYHYKTCGLDDVYLLNGFKYHDSEYGEGGISVENAEELHKAIGMHLIMHKKALSPKEIKFLRKTMNVTQEELGGYLSVTGQTVARYEKGETDPGPADKLIRFAFAFSLLPEKERAKLLEKVMKAQERLRKTDEAAPTALYFTASETGWDLTCQN